MSPSKKKVVKTQRLSTYAVDLNTRILEAGAHLDVVFETKQGVIGAHRCILASASGALKSLVEDKTSPMPMDMSLPALRAFLKLVYTKQYEKVCIQENGLEVLAACVKYDLPSLVRVCVPILCKSINVDNCLAYAEAAAMYDDDLYRISSRFVCKHFDEVVMTDAYQDLTCRKPNLAVALVRGTVKHKWSRFCCARF
ncbi:hypothetical protein MPTK1_1g19060 [Marchantia polymorpha subsp. ruderalis]|uniref:BTB domain-containing protein n=2 Tax=Marchantia polymorpha TaxID=3197 RepID=A0AAF6ARR8_MARPO|nr:hypothetical protein MARPO_0001s0244 [Marchantia polymorpha]BBM99138.1 hypothetical protein Mp_1g19060 [Marchantia polymorpha subsp. ruderalis]|eukprot:PTQ50215.1 hypothetical protein MARPO_0001s0244 [Marchantia polymorpha]